MSYDISLVDPVTKETLELDSPHFMRGGTYAIGGTTEACLNITYNYSRWYYMDGVFPDRGGHEDFSNGLQGIRSLYGLSGAESVPILQKAIAVLEAMTDDLNEQERREYEAQGAGGYWMPTRANAIKPLYQLLALARMRPDGVWDGD